MSATRKITSRDKLGADAEKSARELALGDRLSHLAPKSTTGIVFAGLLYVASMSPSLLPRSWWWQGVVSGILIAFGYAVGVLLAWVFTRLWRAAKIQVSADHTWVTWTTRVVYALAVVAVVWALVGFYHANNASAQLTGMPPMTVFSYAVATVVALFIASALVGLALAIRGLWRFVMRFAKRILPEWIAGLAATIVVIFVVTFISSDVLFETGMEYTYKKFSEEDRETPPGISQPALPQRTGSPLSYESWPEIGFQGKKFVAKGPRAADIRRVTGQESREPIRIYGSLMPGRDLEDVAQIVVDELYRTNAFDRSALLISTVTGTGWVEEWGVQPFEFLTRGDCATVAMQYSYVPSAIAFLREFEAPAESSRVLYDAIMTEVDKLPAGERPAIYLNGVSLGAYGSQSIFEDAADLIEGVDGALWAGTPHATNLWQELTENRHMGSPEIAPVVDSGRNIRFATKPEDLDRDIYGRAFPQWEYPRIAYAQHGTDPVVWWSPELINHRPDWLREPAHADINPLMQWIRGATFIQVSADLPIAGLAADGHGHTYHRELIPMWEKVLGLDESGVEGNPYRGADGSWITSDVIEKMIGFIEKDIYG